MLNICFDFSRNERIEFMKWCETHFPSFQRPNMYTTGECALFNRSHRLYYAYVKILENTRQYHICNFRIGHCPIGVDADYVSAAVGSCCKGGACPYVEPRYWQDNVHASLQQLLRDLATFRLTTETTNEQALMFVWIPAKHLDPGSILFVVICNTKGKAIHEIGDGWHVDAAEDPDL